MRRMTTLDASVVRRFADRAAAALGEAREEIDDLNVYPVPDGDTGTNLYLTMVAARDALVEAVDAGQSTSGSLQAFATGALLGARGNSGVILSQLIGGMVARIRASRRGERPAVVFAQGLQQATDASYVAVGTPVEGTILSVARAASETALAVAVHPGHDLAQVVTRAAEAARRALAATPDQLPVLREAGVVDAGGRGLCVLLDVAEAVLTGRPGLTYRPERRTPPAAPPPSPTSGSPAYEVMYLLDADDDRVPALRERLGSLGDSLVVVGGAGLWNVHVHVDDAGAAIEAGIESGRPHRVRITHLADQAAARHRPATSGRAVVAVAAGPGLEATFRAAGAVVVPAVVGERPSVGRILEAIRATGAAEVVVLPNDPDTRRAAELAAATAEQDGRVSVAVIPTDAQVQGLAALAVHDADRPFEHDVRDMAATARHARHGAVTVAARRAITSAGPCEPGDVLGVVEGDFTILGDDLFAVAVEVVERLVGAGGDLVTLVGGAAQEPAQETAQEADREVARRTDDEPAQAAKGETTGPDLAARVAAEIERRHPLVDVVVYDGGQQRYPLLMSVE